MNVSSAWQLARPAASEAEPCLYAVLVDLGHLCPGTCRSLVEELAARVWFARRRPLSSGRRHSAMVVIDTQGYVGSVARSHHLLHQLNDCTKVHGIHVIERRRGDAGLALAAAAPSLRELTWVCRNGPCSGCRPGNKNILLGAES